MRLYKKIIKGLFIGFVLVIFISFFYEVFLSDVIGTGEYVFPSYDVWVPMILFLMGNLSVALFHIIFFNVYDTNRVWRNTTVLEILGFIINFVYSGLFFLFGLMMVFSDLDIVPLLMLGFGGYLFIESVFVIRYLKRDITNELSCLVEGIGED